MKGLQDTPVLLLDLKRVKKNIRDVVQFATKHKLNYRPHVKTHKSIRLAKMQRDYGAVGVTVATVGEAEVMARGGIGDILIAYPIATKLERVEKLLEEAKITIAIDSVEQVRVLEEFFTHSMERLSVWIKVNSGLNRCGVEPEEAGELAVYVKEHTNLNLTGIFTHAGHSYAAGNFEELEKIGLKEAEAVLEAVEKCEAIGVDIKHRSIGSTPTFKIAGKVAGITEIRPGNAIFYDMVQVGLGVATIEQCALSVLTTVGSKHRDRIVIDAGSKTLNLDRGAHGHESIKGHGYIKEYPDLIIERLSEEHGVIPIEEDVEIGIMDQLTIIPNHACTVVNLFDHYIVHDGGEVVGKWKIDARGKVD